MNIFIKLLDNRVRINRYVTLDNADIQVTVFYFEYISYCTPSPFLAVHGALRRKDKRWKRHVPRAITSISGILKKCGGEF